MVIVLQFICILCTFYAVDASSFHYDYQYDQEHKLWFKLYSQGEEWLTANNTCHQEGAILASPIDNGLIKIFRDIAKEHGVVRTHVGIHATAFREDWKTIEGISLSLFKDNLFAINLNKSTPCTMLEYGHVQSVNCSKVNSFVCYKRDLAATHLTACEPGDKGMKNGGSDLTNKYLRLPSTDSITYIFGLDNNKDIILNPLSLNRWWTLKDGYTYNEETGQCYKFHRQANTWMRGFGICFAEKGYLAIVNSQTEAIALRDLFQMNVDSVINANDLSYAHIGFVDWDKTGMWRTIDGKSLENSGYWDWDYGEPNNLRSDEHCGSIFVSNGRLNDKFCHQKLAFICEKDVKNKILG